MSDRHQNDDDSQSNQSYLDHQRTVTVSAPGKALIAGGYLVLEKPNIGLVIAVDKRFYATVRLGNDGGRDEHDKFTPLSPSIYQENKDSPSSLRTIRVDVHSPQFDVILSYHLVYDTKSKDVTLKPLLSSASQKPNPFIEKTIACTISFLLHHDPTALIQIPSSRNHRLLIKLRADNDFYSPIPYLQKHSLPMTPSVVSSLPPFLPCPQHHTSSRPTKTGLGSSAALVTSLVGALLRFFDIRPSRDDDDDDDDDGKRLTTTPPLTMIHNLAQTCHCLAQRKIGSGFDIAAAVYGSLTYVRWDPSLLDGWGTDDDDDDDDESSSTRLTEECYRRLTTEWTTDRDGRSLPLPPGVELLMADVCGGSESPSMARKILKRKETCPALREVWQELKRTNRRLRDILTCWSSSDDDDRREDFRATFRQARSLLKRMGCLADVPVEPDGQTVLADATMEIPGVIVAGVPGAGGYDALFCLYMGGDEVREEIGRFWSSWEGEEGSGVVCPLAVRSGGTEGVRMEDLAWD